MTTLLNRLAVNLRLAARSVLKARGFSLVVVATLAGMPVGDHRAGYYSGGRLTLHLGGQMPEA